MIFAGSGIITRFAYTSGTDTDSPTHPPSRSTPTARGVRFQKLLAEPQAEALWFQIVLASSEGKSFLLL